MAEVVKSYQYQMPPEYVQQRQQELLNTLFGVNGQQGLVETPLPVIGQQVAGFSPAQQQAFQMAQQGIGGYMPYLQAAEAATGQAQNIATQAGQMFQPGAAQAFMDPYQQNVTQDALAEIRRQGDIALQSQAAQALKQELLVVREKVWFKQKPNAVFKILCHEEYLKIYPETISKH